MTMEDKENPSTCRTFCLTGVLSDSLGHTDTPLSGRQVDPGRSEPNSYTVECPASLDCSMEDCRLRPNEEKVYKLWNEMSKVKKSTPKESNKRRQKVRFADESNVQIREDNSSTAVGRITTQIDHKNYKTGCCRSAADKMYESKTISHQHEFMKRACTRATEGSTVLVIKKNIGSHDRLEFSDERPHYTTTSHLNIMHANKKDNSQISIDSGCYSELESSNSSEADAHEHADNFRSVPDDEYYKKNACTWVQEDKNVFGIKKDIGFHEHAYGHRNQGSDSNKGSTVTDNTDEGTVASSSSKQCESIVPKDLKKHKSCKPSTGMTDKCADSLETISLGMRSSRDPSHYMAEAGMCQLMKTDLPVSNSSNSVNSKKPIRYNPDMQPVSHNSRSHSDQSVVVCSHHKKFSNTSSAFESDFHLQKSTHEFTETSNSNHAKRLDAGAMSEKISGLRNHSNQHPVPRHNATIPQCQVNKHFRPVKEPNQPSATDLVDEGVPVDECLTDFLANVNQENLASFLTFYDRVTANAPLQKDRVPFKYKVENP